MFKGIFCFSGDPHSKLGMQHASYRPDIDGLRAIAVWCVVVYHAFPSLLKGGFIGVDVFFVISGFLISNIIWGNLEKNRFSLIDFYARRVRRIFPVLILVLVAVLSFGAVSLWNGEFARLGKHVAAGAAFISNIMLWSESGYFDVDARTKPLLHLWSLGIEEQFYIFWPMLLGLGWRLRWAFVPIAGTIAILSFATNLALIYGAADISSSFYLPFSRFWELMVGGILAYLCLHKPAYVRLYPEAQSWIGLILIGAGAVFVDPAANFPGWLALLPTCGAVLIIAAGKDSFLNRTVLGNGPITWMGRVSYPFYLWHWPFIAFANIMAQGQHQPRGIRIALVLLSLLCAAATYVYIEKPLQRGRRKTALSLACVMICVGALGGWLWKINGNIHFGATSKYGQAVTAQPDALDPTAFGKALRGAAFSESPIKGIDALAKGRIPDYVAPGTVLSIGDSHATRLFGGLRFAGRRDNATVGHVFCPPFYDVDGVDTTPFSRSFGCQPAMNSQIDVIRQIPQIRTVILTGFFNQLNRGVLLRDVNTNAPISLADGIERTIQRLAPTGSRIIVALDAPELPVNCIKRPFPIWEEADDSHCRISKSDALAQNAEIEERVTQLMKLFPNLFLFRASDSLCNQEMCGEIDDKEILYLPDGNHLTIAGAKRVGSALSALIDQLP